MSAIIYLVGMIFSSSLFQPGSAKTDLPQMNDAELENFINVKGSFQCEGTSCQCCVNIGIDFVSGSQKACINVKYLSENIGIFLNISLQGQELYSEEVSVRNPPPICPTHRLLKKISKLCLELYNMTFSEENLAGCARISLKLFLLTEEIPLGCFGTSLNEDSKIDSIGENERNRETNTSSNQNERTGETDTSSNQNERTGETDTSRNQNERTGETDTSSNQNERTGETDTSSNQNAGMEGKNNGNKQGREIEIYGLSLMFLFLINQ